MDSSAAAVEGERTSYYLRFPRRAPRREPLSGPVAEAWMDVDEAAALLHVAPNTIRRRASAAVLESTHRGGRLVVSRGDVSALAERIAAGVEPRDRRTLTGRAGRPSNSWNDEPLQTRPAVEPADVSTREVSVEPVVRSVPPSPASPRTTTPWRPAP